jgi:hypothetical protein
MKKLLIQLLILFTTICINAQTINIEYIRGSYKGKCVEENHRVIFSNNTYTRIDLYDNSEISGPSQMIRTGYDDDGTYWETWSPLFYLERYGINEYHKVNQYTIQVFYEKRGGNVIYVVERNNEIKNDSGKYLLTSIGAEKFCKQ